MRSDAPTTPMFDAELEALLTQRAMVPHRRLPVRLAALRSLWNVNRIGLHAALACGLAATLLLTSPNDGMGQRLPLTPEPDATPAPGYLYQYGGPDIEELIANGRAQGYEVQVRRSFVTDASDHQRVLSIRHAGTELNDLPGIGVRGPLLIVTGFAVGDRHTTAD